MKIKSIIIISFTFIMYACGSKKINNTIPKVTSIEEFRSELKAIQKYQKKVDSNKKLQEEIIESSTTTTDSLDAISYFQYSAFFDERSKELYRIKNMLMAKAL